MSVTIFTMTVSEKSPNLGGSYLNRCAPLSHNMLVDLKHSCHIKREINFYWDEMRKVVKILHVGCFFFLPDRTEKKTIIYNLCDYAPLIQSHFKIGPSFNSSKKQGKPPWNVLHACHGYPLICLMWQIVTALYMRQGQDKPLCGLCQSWIRKCEPSLLCGAARVSTGV